MNYLALDSILRDWAQRRALPLATEYRDEQVRSFELVGKVSGIRFQLWVDPIRGDGMTVVHAWDRKKWKIDMDASLLHLASTLDKALEEIERRDRAKI